MDPTVIGILCLLVALPGGVHDTWLLYEKWTTSQPKWDKSHFVSLSKIVAWCLLFTLGTVVLVKGHRKAESSAPGIIAGANHTTSAIVTPSTSSAATAQLISPAKTASRPFPLTKPKITQHILAGPAPTPPTSTEGIPNAVPQPVSPSPQPTYQQQCVGSACAQGQGSQATLTTQFNVPYPLPNVIVLKSSALSANKVPVEPVSGSSRAQFLMYQMQISNKSQYNPGFQVAFKVDSLFVSPMFTAHCDKPCTFEDVSINGAFNGNNPAFSTGRADEVGFSLGYLQQLYSNQEVTLTVRSVNGSAISNVSITAFAPTR